jgi:hypothetical protein
MKKKRLGLDRFVMGGLHRDDFVWASREWETDGYVLVAFELDCDGYHWRATYARIGPRETPSRGRTTRLCLSRPLYRGEPLP